MVNMKEVDLSSDNPNDELSRLEWIQTVEELRSSNRHIPEGVWARTVRKFKETPLVPIGMALTTACLTYGIISMARGDSVMQQRMMRGRVGAQGFTVAAIVISLLAATTPLTSKKSDSSTKSDS